MLTPQEQQQIQQIISASNAAFGRIRSLEATIADLQKRIPPGGLTPLHPRFIEDIPGKRVPYTYSTAITLTNTTLTTGTIQVSQDGPFLATGIVASWRPTAGANSGRYRPISSVNAMKAITAGAYLAEPDTIDFLWNYRDSGSDRFRQDQDRSSVELFSNQDRPNYLPIADYFERSTAVTVGVTALYTPSNAGVLLFSFLGYKLIQPIAFAG